MVFLLNCLFITSISCCSEVQKAVQTARGLYQRWCELLDDPNTVSREEYDWTTNELRNSLRSIEWDVEDLEETINILFDEFMDYAKYLIQCIVRLVDPVC